MEKIKIIYIIVALFLPIFNVTGISSAALLSLGNRSYCPGIQSAYLPVDIINETGENVSAINFDISYDINQLIFKKAVASHAALDAEKSIASSIPFPGVIRMVVSGLNRNAIADGRIANIFFDIPLTALPGVVNLTLNNVVGSDPNANHITINVVSGSIIIGNEMSVEMNMIEGFNMISLPVIPENALVSELFPEAGVVYSYEKEFGYIRLTEKDAMEVGKGYWILFNEPQLYILTGLPINGYQFSVSENRWYMIGGCTFPSQASSENCEIDIIYRYVPGIGYQRVLESESFDPGKGYWIKANDIVDQAIVSIEKAD